MVLSNMNIDVEKILTADHRTLSRMISMIESGDPEAFRILSTLDSSHGNAIVVGITGAPGAGKSSIVNELINEIRATGKSVAIIAVDPSSPFTGGSILGDRIRMGTQYKDRQVFIRSLSSHGESGGIPLAISSILRLLDRANMDFIIVETVGVGQSELNIMNVVDTVLVALTPESGDSIQMIKAGLMEIADIYVVNKADRPGSDKLIAELKTSLHYGLKKSSYPTPVIRTEAINHKGIVELLSGILKNHDHMKTTGNLQEKRRKQRSNEMKHIVQSLLSKHLDELINNHPHFRAINDTVMQETADPYESSKIIFEEIIRILDR
jgi:LAO/AO transport system kinase